MLVQLLGKGNELIDESILKNCYSMVDVCTEAIDGKWSNILLNESNRRIMPDDFGSNCLIGTMGRNQGKSATINTACSKIQKQSIWMV